MRRKSIRRESRASGIQVGIGQAGWQRFAAVAALVVACSLWGASFIFAKIAMRELDSVQVVIWRFVIASAVFLPVVLLRREWPRRGDLPLLVLTGFSGVPAVMLLQFAGVSLTPAATAALLIGAFPVLLAVAATLTGTERLSPGGWAAVAVSTLGVALIVGRPHGASGWLGPTLVLLSLVSAAAWVLISKRLMVSYSPLSATAYTILFGTATMLPFGWLSTQSVGAAFHARSATWLALLGMGLGCTVVSFFLWNWALKYVETYRAGVFGNFEPLVGAILGVVVLHETLGPFTWFGGGLILLSAVAVTLMPERR